MDHPVIHFEIPAKDLEKMKKFYTDLFGWKIAGAGYGEYQMVETKTGEAPGINGGMMRKQGPQHTCVNYVMVESVADYSDTVKKLGGQVVVPKTAIPKMGYFAMCLDPEGNPIGLFENDTNAA